MDHATRVCRRKRAYLSQSLAANTAVLYSWAYGYPVLRAYPCPVCSDWHLTHRGIDSAAADLG